MRLRKVFRTWPIFSDESGNAIFRPGLFFSKQSFIVPNSKDEKRIKILFLVIQVLIWLLWTTAIFAFHGQYTYALIPTLLLVTWLIIKSAVNYVAKDLICTNLAVWHSGQNPAFISLGKVPALVLTAIGVGAVIRDVAMGDRDIFSMFLFVTVLPAGIYNFALILRRRGK